MTLDMIIALIEMASPRGTSEKLVLAQAVAWVNEVSKQEATAAAAPPVPTGMLPPDETGLAAE